MTVVGRLVRGWGEERREREGDGGKGEKGNYALLEKRRDVYIW